MRAPGPMPRPTPYLAKRKPRWIGLTGQRAPGRQRADVQRPVELLPDVARRTTATASPNRPWRHEHEDGQDESPAHRRSMAREVRSHNDPVRFALLAVAVLAALSLLASSASAGGGPGDSSLQFGYGKNVRMARAIKFCNVYGAEAQLRECLTKQLFQLVLESHDSAQELPRIDAYVASSGGYLQRSCHVLMHGVGRRYGAAVHLTIGRLLDYLPHTNDANCSAGFGHGLLMYLAPQIGSLSPEEAANACNGAPTRYQRYSCTHGFGHAYMRLYGEQLPFALHACKLLGPEERGRLRGRRVPRLLDRGSGTGQREASRRSLVTSPAKLCPARARGLRARLLVPRTARAPAAQAREDCRGRPQRASGPRHTSDMAALFTGLGGGRQEQSRPQPRTKPPALWHREFSRGRDQLRKMRFALSSPATAIQSSWNAPAAPRAEQLARVQREREPPRRAACTVSEAAACSCSADTASVRRCARSPPPRG